MKMTNCFVCAIPVLEIDGQFEKIDPPLRMPRTKSGEEIASGSCHVRCLARSDWGPHWSQRQLGMHLAQKRRIVAAHEHWTVLRDDQTKISYALHCNGPGYYVHPSEGTARIRRVNEGVLLSMVVKRFDLELDDPRAIEGIHERLELNGSYPLSKLIYGYGADEKMVFVREVAERAELRLDPALRAHWSENAVSAEAHYERFVPNELLFALAN